MRVPTYKNEKSKLELVGEKEMRLVLTQLEGVDER